MQRKFIQLSLLTAALTLTACSSDSLQVTSQDVVAAANQDDNSIQFGTYMGNQATRGDYVKGPIVNGDVDNDNSLKNAKFGVFSYLTTDNSDYNPSTVNVSTSPSNINPNFMYNQEITWNTSSPAAWVYTPVKYWPNGVDKPGTATEMEIQKLSFFAYAPYKASSTFNTIYAQGSYGNKPTAIGNGTANDGKVKLDKTVNNGIQAMTTNEWTGNVWLKYLLPYANETEAVDLLWGTNGQAQYQETDGTPSASIAIGGGYNLNLTKQKVDEKVKFLFKHALAKVGGSTTTTRDPDQAAAKCHFKIQVDVDGNNGDNQNYYFGSNFSNTSTLVTVKEVKIMDGETANSKSYTTETTTSNIYNSGWFNIETGTWDQLATGAKIDITVQNNKAQYDPATYKYTLSPVIRENTENPAVKNTNGSSWNSSADSSTDGYTGGASGVTATAQSLFAEEYVPALMFIPGSADQTIYVYIDYFVRTADANLSTGYTEVEQKIINKVTLPATLLQSNNIYNIIMHLGLTSVKFEAKVAEWATQNGGTYDGEGEYTPAGVDNTESVWLPSNVVPAP